MRMYIFDLDHTILKCNTFLYFTLFIAKQNIFHFLLNIPNLIACAYLFIYTKNIRYKSKFIKILLEDIDKTKLKILANHFAKKMIKKKLNKKIYSIIKKKKIYTNSIIISASPSIYVLELSKMLRIKKCFCTMVSLNPKKYGEVIGNNCFGIEKKRILLKKIKKFNKVKSTCFTDSLSDKPLLDMCSDSYLVNNETITKYK